MRHRPWDAQDDDAIIDDYERGMCADPSKVLNRHAVIYGPRAQAVSRERKCDQ
jgi:hypothetical protein